MSAPRDPALTRALESGLTCIVKVFRKMATAEAQARDLTHTQYITLHRLTEVGEQRMSDLASFLELTNSAATGIIERLDARGLVARRPDPEDGRAVRVGVTPAGQAMAAELKGAVLAKLAIAFDQLGEAERHMAVGGVTALAEKLRDLHVNG